MHLRPFVCLVIASSCLAGVAMANDPPVTSGSSASASAGSSATTASASAEAASPPTKKVTCRNEKVTGSSFRTRKVCSTPESESGSQEWVRNQQQRGAIGASAIPNQSGGG